jgi:hypothetical protein
MITAENATRETLLRRVRLFITITASVFAVIIVVLICQFSVIAYNNQLKAELAAKTEKLQQQTEDANKEINYIESGLFEKDKLQNDYGKQ